MLSKMLEDATSKTLNNYDVILVIVYFNRLTWLTFKHTTCTWPLVDCGILSVYLICKVDVFSFL